MTNKKEYILDFSETQMIQKIFKNKTVNWGKDENVIIFEELIYELTVDIAKDLGLDPNYQDSEKGIVAQREKDILSFDTKKYNTPYLRITLESPKLEKLHNEFMKLLMNDNEFLSGFLNFETKEGLDTVLPGNVKYQ